MSRSGRRLDTARPGYPDVSHPIIPSPPQHCTCEQGGAAQVPGHAAVGGQEQAVLPVAHGGVRERAENCARHLVRAGSDFLDAAACFMRMTALQMQGFDHCTPSSLRRAQLLCSDLCLWRKHAIPLSDGACRDAMRDENMSMSDGLVMRSLLAYPGGLELHIGVLPVLAWQTSAEHAHEIYTGLGC